MFKSRAFQASDQFKPANTTLASSAGHTLMSDLKNPSLFCQESVIEKQKEQMASGNSFFNCAYGTNEQDKENQPHVNKGQAKDNNKFIHKLLQQLSEAQSKLKSEQRKFQRTIVEFQYKISRQKKLNEQLKNHLVSDRNILSIESQQLIRSLKTQLQLTHLSYNQKLKESELTVEKKEKVIQSLQKRLSKLASRNQKFLQKHESQQHIIDADMKQITGLKNLIEEYQQSLIATTNKLEVAEKKNRQIQKRFDEARDRCSDLESEVLIMEGQIQRFTESNSALGQSVEAKNKFIQHLEKQSEELQKLKEERNQKMNRQYNKAEEIFKENNFLREQLILCKRKVSQLSSTNQKNEQLLNTQRKSREQVLHTAAIATEERCRQLVKQQKQKAVKSIQKIQDRFATKERLIKKMFMKGCHAMKEQVVKIKVHTEKQMLLFMKLHTRDLKKLAEEGIVSTRF